MQTRGCDAMAIQGVHHVAIICSDYSASKRFYTEILGLAVIAETYRRERQSYKLDLRVGAHGRLELFSFQNPPPRASRPEACGLRHLAFGVDDLDRQIEVLRHRGVSVEGVRTDALTGKRFAFFADPDGLPLELYEH